MHAARHAIHRHEHRVFRAVYNTPTMHYIHVRVRYQTSTELCECDYYATLETTIFQ
jgi:hypothetical protein